MKRNTIMTIIGTLIVLVLLVLYFSYAFLTDIHKITNMNVTTYTGNATTFRADDTPYLNLAIDDSLMGEDNIGNIVATVNTDFNVTIETENDSITCCNYDINILESCVTNDYMAGLSFDISRNNVKINSIELNPEDYTTSYFDQTIYSDSICASKNNSSYTKTYNIAANFTNLDIPQEKAKNEYLCFDVSVHLNGCSAAPIFAHLIEGQDVMGSVVEETDAIPTGTKSALINYGKYGTRYVGEEANNYVLFNCDDVNNPTVETCQRWRIIGLFDDNIHGVSGKSLTKIGYFESIGPTDTAYDVKNHGTGSAMSDNPSGSNEWYDSQLMMLLNPTSTLPEGYAIDSQTGEVSDPSSNVIYRNYGGYYYGLSNGYYPSSKNSELETYDFSTIGLKNDNVRNMINQNTVWYLGNDDLVAAGYQYNLLLDIFEAERNGTPWTGPIALMYPSDFYFNTTGSDSFSRTECLNGTVNTLYASETKFWRKNNGNCPLSSWVFVNKPTGSLALYGKSDYGNYACILGVAPVGTLSDPGADDKSIIFPTLYLKSHIRVLSGTGTYADPYVLGV